MGICNYKMLITYIDKICIHLLEKERTEENKV